MELPREYWITGIQILGRRIELKPIHVAPGDKVFVNFETLAVEIEPLQNAGNFGPELDPRCATQELPQPPAT